MYLNIIRKAALLCLTVAFSLNLTAQDNSSFSSNFYGYVGFDAFYDTRQVTTARQGLVILYPLNEDLDPEGVDRNEGSEFNFTVVSTRLGAEIEGPDILGAASSANVEIDFLGTGKPYFNLIRLRQANVTLDWNRFSVLAGQNWHPMFVTECLPGVVAHAGGIPYHALNRAPQVKLRYKTGPLNLSLTILAHSDFSSLGPDGSTNDYLRKSGSPEAILQAIYESGNVLVGGTAGYHTLRPGSETPAGFSTSEEIGGFVGNIFTTLTFDEATLKMMANYGQNNSHLVMQGGYGETGPVNPARLEYGYTGIHAFSLWSDAEIHPGALTGLFSEEDALRLGIFGGYSRNLGSDEEITGDVWARGSDISHMYRISPRAVYSHGQASLGFELIYDIAAYGNPDNRFEFEETNEVSNLRTLLSLRYNF